MDSEEARAKFAEKAGAVLGAAYQDGAHVNLRYDEDGKIVADGTGPTVVEYIRCGGWEWEPVSPVKYVNKGSDTHLSVGRYRREGTLCLHGRRHPPHTQGREGRLHCGGTNE